MQREEEPVQKEQPTVLRERQVQTAPQERRELPALPEHQVRTALQERRVRTAPQERRARLGRPERRKPPALQERRVRTARPSSPVVLPEVTD
ncbi:MAG: hypothetical protein NVS4B2_13240 [Chloroflexota bacterium]